jgi:hypothetical protein
MFNFSQTIDPVTVLNKMREMGVYHDNSRDYIQQLMEITPTAANVVRYANIVRDKAMLRGLATAAGQISDAAYAETIKTLQSRLDALTVNGTDPEQSAPTSDLVFRYKLEGSNAVITGFSGSSTLVSIPAALDGHPVTAIGERAFEGQSITAVVLPEGLESIGWFAFYGCKTLIDVTIPNSVSSIGYAVFDGCPNVTLVCHKDSYAAAYAASYGLACISPF